MKKKNLSQVLSLLTDGSYTGEHFASRIKDLIGATVEVVKRNELHTLVVLPKRGVVERSFAWLEKCRRLGKNCERKLATSRSMVVLAFLALLLKRFRTGTLPSELISFIQPLRPLMRVEVFSSFCFLLMGVLIGEAKHGTVRSSVFAPAADQPQRLSDRFCRHTRSPPVFIVALACRVLRPL